MLADENIEIKFYYKYIYGLQKTGLEEQEYSKDLIEIVNRKKRE